MRLEFIRWYESTRFFGHHWSRDGKYHSFCCGPFEIRLHWGKKPVTELEKLHSILTAVEAYLRDPNHGAVAKVLTSDDLRILAAAARSTLSKTGTSTGEPSSPL